jgi:hypothetical protein
VPKVCDNLFNEKVLAIDQIIRFGVSTRLTGCDSKTSHEVIRNCPDGRLQLQWCPVCGNEPVDGKPNNEGDVQPVDVLVPVGSRNWLFGDVRLLGIVLLASRLKRLGHA